MSVLRSLSCSPLSSTALAAPCCTSVRWSSCTGWGGAGAGAGAAGVGRARLAAGARVQAAPHGACGRPAPHRSGSAPSLTGGQTQPASPPAAARPPPAAPCAGREGTAPTARSLRGRGGVSRAWVGGQDRARAGRGERRRERCTWHARLRGGACHPAMPWHLPIWVSRTVSDTREKASRMPSTAVTSCRWADAPDRRRPPTHPVAPLADSSTPTSAPVTLVCGEGQRGNGCVVAEA